MKNMMNMNYHHLHYFWVIATEGSMARAAERLGVAVQTVSSQVRAIERSLGVSLLRPAGRGLALTEAGRMALREADEIFRIGERLPGLLSEAGRRAARQRLAIGLADGLPKLLVHRLLQPVLGASGLHLQCFEGPPEDLLAQLALHRLDVVLSDRAPASNPNLKLYTHRLCESPLLWFAPPRLAAAARRDFPASLQHQPVLLPSTHAAMRGLLERWFERQGLQPQVVGEFQDSALLKTFGAAGLGLFPAMALVQEELQTRYGVKPVGACEGVVETIYAVGTEKRVQHPLVARLLATGPKSAP